MSDFISVSLLTGYIKNIISAEEILHNIKLVGEVSGLRCSGAHAYFTLKDENAQIQCNCFSYAKTYLPKNGESVCLVGSVDFYAPNGKLSFNARKIEPLGQGLLALQLEQLRQKLEKAGYFDVKHKKPIPKYPLNVCVITAKTGAVIRDIVSTIRKKNLILNIDVVDVKVQGQFAENSIIDALNFVDSIGYDAIIIARGGGSMEDLMPFNSERLVYKIYECKTPIISAVGHETDFTLCDFVADIRVPTPTAGGELVGFDVKELQNNLLAYCEIFKKQLDNRMQYASLQLNQAVKSIVNKLQLNLLESESKVKHLANSFGNIFKLKCVEGEHKISKIMARIDANNPIRILGQGYSKLYGKNGLPTSIEQVAVGDDIIVLTNGGKIDATINNVTITNQKERIENNGI